jgi:hypothetical protein
LRHKSATTTSRYLHSLRGAKVALDEVFAREPGKIIPFEKIKKPLTNRGLKKTANQNCQPGQILKLATT